MAERINYTVHNPCPIERNGQQITRVDFTREHGTTGRWIMRMYAADWSVYETMAVVHETKPHGYNIEAAKAWFVDNGWSVRTLGHSIVRAWAGFPQPVRLERRIKEMREEAKHLWNRERRLPAWCPADVKTYAELERVNLALVP